MALGKTLPRAFCYVETDVDPGLTQAVLNGNHLTEILISAH